MPPYTTFAAHNQGLKRGDCLDWREETVKRQNSEFRQTCNGSCSQVLGILFKQKETPPCNVPAPEVFFFGKCPKTARFCGTPPPLVVTAGLDGGAPGALGNAWAASVGLWASSSTPTRAAASDPCPCSPAGPPQTHPSDCQSGSPIPPSGAERWRLGGALRSVLGRSRCWAAAAAPATAPPQCPRVRPPPGSFAVPLAQLIVPATPKFHPHGVGISPKCPRAGFSEQASSLHPHASVLQLCAALPRE